MSDSVISNQESLSHRKRTPKSSVENEKIAKSQVDQSRDEGANFSDTLAALAVSFGFPVYVWALIAFCDEFQCSFTEKPNFEKYSSLSTYLHWPSFLYYAIYLGTLAFVCILPIGGKKMEGLPTAQGRLKYNLNGLFSIIVVTTFAIILEWLKYPIFDYMIEHRFHLFVAITVESFILSVYLFVRSFFLPITALTTHTLNSNVVYAFYIGRELNPRFFFNLLDLKLYILRLCLLGTILYDLAYVWKNLVSVNFDIFSCNWTLMSLFIIHAVYLLDGLVVEYTWITSYEILHEGVGFMTVVGYSLWPFMFPISIMYINDYQVELNVWLLTTAMLVFVAGYSLFRLSNSEKDAFKKDPNQPRFKGKTTITGTQGKKLLADGYWGWLRHPNYLGDILIQISCWLFVYDVPIQIQFPLIIIFLCHRAARDNKRCKNKYGATWEKYCNKVKYMVFPGIY